MSHYVDPALTAVTEDTQARQALFHNRAFLLLWFAQALSQVAQNAIFYALMVYIESTTGSSAQMSILVLTTVLPTIVFGVMAGVLVDRADKKFVLAATNLIRAILVIGFMVAGESLAAIFLFNVLFSITSQFFMPAEVSFIPLIVKRRQLLAANGIFHITFTGAQLGGFVLVGPPLLKIAGQTTLFIIILATFLCCAVLTSFLPKDPRHESPRETSGRLIGRQIVRGLRAELAAAWELLRGNRLIKQALTYVTMTTMLMMIMSMLAPGYVTRVVGIQADDAVFVLAPAGFGMIVGTIVLARLRISKVLAINSGLGGIGLAVFGLAAAQPLVSPIPVPAGPWGETHWLLIGTVMLLALVLGVAFGFVQVPAQTILQEQAPPRMRGKVFAVQLTLGSLVSVPPLVVLGGLADLFGLIPIMIVMGVVISSLAIYSVRHLESAVREPEPRIEESGPGIRDRDQGSGIGERAAETRTQASATIWR
jgi:MFS family permease